MIPIHRFNSLKSSDKFILVTTYLHPPAKVGEFFHLSYIKNRVDIKCPDYQKRSANAGFFDTIKKR